MIKPAADNSVRHDSNDAHCCFTTYTVCAPGIAEVYVAVSGVCVASSLLAMTVIGGVVGGGGGEGEWGGC